MTSRPSLNALFHSYTCIRDKVDLDNFNDSAAVIPLKSQNLKQLRGSVFCFHDKNRKQAASKQTLIGIWSSNFTRT